MLLAAVLALALLPAAPAMAQDDPQVVADAVNKTPRQAGPVGLTPTPTATMRSSSPRPEVWLLSSL